MIEQLDKVGKPTDIISSSTADVPQIAHTEFPIPKLPLPIDPRSRLLSPLPSSPIEQSSSQEADKENAPTASSEPSAPAQPVQQLEPGELPKQIATILDGIITHLKSFETHPPHTIQRLSELVLRPRAHYKALAPYLHAVDRVVHVTSSTSIYPLPPAIPDMASMSINGDGADNEDPAAAVGWANPTNGTAAAAAAAAADEALGGALLTPIPWLSRPSPESNNGDSSAGSSGGSATGGSGAQIHSESTETIEGPNGVGSIETVSVSINGVSSTGHARGVTQGELLRQEQRAGVVPVSQLSRGNNAHHDAPGRATQDDEDGEERTEDGGDEDGKGEGDGEEPQEEETPHARGPDEIGAGDIGPQSVSTSFVGEGGLDSHDIDVEAAVGRKHDADDVGASAPTTSSSPPTAVDEEEGKEPVSATESEDGKTETEKGDAASPEDAALAGTKRGAEGQEEEGLAAKKLKEEKERVGDEMDTDTTTT